MLRTHPSEDNFFGRLGRAYLLVRGKRARIVASLFYMLDVIRSIILYRWEAADHIVFVRYLMGTAYLPRPLHKLGYLFFFRLVPTSGYMMFVDVPPEEALRRIESRSEGRKEVFESLEKLHEVRENALELVSIGGWKVINGDQSRIITHCEIIDFLAL